MPEMSPVERDVAFEGAEGKLQGRTRVAMTQGKMRRKVRSGRWSLVMERGKLEVERWS